MTATRVSFVPESHFFVEVSRQSQLKRLVEVETSRVTDMNQVS